MGVHDSFDVIGSRIQNYVENPHDAHARELVEQSLERTGIMNNKEALGELNRRLEDAGLLPRFLSAEISRIDRYDQGGNPYADGRLTEQELKLAATDRTNNDAATRLAAQYGESNYGNLRHEVGFWRGIWDGFAADDLKSYAARQQENRQTLDPHQVFSGNTRDDSFCAVDKDSLSFDFNDVNSGALGKSGRAQSNADWEPGAAMYRAKGADGQQFKEGHGQAGGFAATSDADLLPGQKCINGSEVFTVADRDFVRNDSGDWQYTIKPGDTVNRIARSILEHRYGGPVSEAQVHSYAQRFAERNGLNKGGRNIDRIYSGDSLIVPCE